MTDWPDHHLRSRRSLTGHRRFVLLMTGALNPVHRGHVAMMVQARRTLEQRGDAVLAGWLSPSHDLYVRPKYARMGAHAYPAATRRALCAAACQDSDWLACGQWESQARHAFWPDFPDVIDALHDHAESVIGGPLHVGYVCGADHLRHISNQLRRPRQWVIAVPRSGTPIGAVSDRVTVADPDPTTAAISATRVRAALDAGAAVDDLLPPAVAALLQHADEP